MPTVALLNGHTFAGGLMTAMAHDYRLAPSPRGFLCLNELLFGAPLKPAMAAMFRYKTPPATFRDLVLEARRFGGQAAVEAGLADAVAPGGLDDALAFVKQRELVGKGKTGVYGTLKAEMYKDLIAFLRGASRDREEERWVKAVEEEGARKEAAGKEVEKNKAKL